MSVAFSPEDVVPLGAVRPSAVNAAHARAGVLRGAVLAAVAGLLALEGWGILVDYGLRVTSDTPTFLALLREQALHPFAAVSPFLAAPGLETSHATPYMQTLAWIWDTFVARHDATGAPIAEPVAAYRLLAVSGVVVTVVALHAFFVWARHEAGHRTAWLSVPVLLLLFGPAHVIWAGDLTLHGFLYASFYPQTLALAFLLYALVVLDRPRPRIATGGGALAVAATMVVHPFTGALLAFLLAANGAVLVARGRPEWRRGSVALVAGFALASLWPAYSLDHALAVAGPSGMLLVAACAAVPFAVRGFVLASPARALVRWLSDASLRLAASTRLVYVLAAAGLALALALAVAQLWLLLQPNPDPLVHSNRLALYWVEDRWRWPLMFAAGAVGLAGLMRLAARGRPLSIVWFASCYLVGVAGIAGAPLPVWWRFLLFCQLPLAVGVADALVTSERVRRTLRSLLAFACAAKLLTLLARRPPALRLPAAVAIPSLPTPRTSSGALGSVVAATLAFVLAFKLVTLLALPQRLTYFGSGLQDAYKLGDVVPTSPGLVATDPFTAYYIPGVTGHHVLSVTKAHVGSAEELAASEAGYDLLRAYATGPRWWQAAQAMWRRGVRYVVVQKQTSLQPQTLADFSTGPTPLVRSKADRRWLGTYFYRNNRVGTVLHDSPTYVVYRLDRRKLWS